jgi:large subunit ribosomal protein L24
MKIKQGDTVQIRSGKDKGKTGTVLKTLRKHQHVLIEGINTVTKHQKPTRRGSQGQLIEKSMPIHVSNVGVLEGDTVVRVGYVFEGEGDKRTKVRVSRPTGKKIK